MILRLARRVLFCLLLLGAWMSARAALVLGNYSASNPIKIMAIGDSITDDCMANGAWRQYLQPLLDANGYPFTFVGRNQSTPSGSFTKIQHEGYCGAVVAPPSVISYAVHGYAGPDAISKKSCLTPLPTRRPISCLSSSGQTTSAADRDPYQVATNDMPNLLDSIFSNAPNANVILAKITSLVSANIDGLNYGAYASNVSVYNAALQAMVNQRRALGQNVSLADMFSVVNINTMFDSDHLHPNALGLQAIAQEWFARIQAITVATNLVVAPLIHGGETWKYSDTGQDLGTNWSQPNYDDSGWASGPARLGYGDTAVATTVSYGPDSTNRYLTTYYRHAFVAPANVVFTNLNFRVSRVDGAVVWLNGQEAFRTNMPSGPIGFNTEATLITTGQPSYIFYPTNLPASGLTAGTNLLAVEVHLRVPTRITSGLDLELLGMGYVPPPPSLAISLSGGNLLVSWPMAGAAGLSLYSTTNLGGDGGWTLSMASAQTNGGQIIVTQSPSASARFFSLRQP